MDQGATSIARTLVGWIGPQRLIDLAFRLRGGDEFLIYRDQRLTRRQVWAATGALAAGLQRLGVQPGERVATLLPACPEAVYTLLLPWFLGTVNVPLNPLLAPQELQHVLLDSAASIAIVPQQWYGQDYPAMLARLLPNLPNVRCVVVAGGDEGDGRVFLPWRAVVAAGGRLRRPPIGLDDVMTIAYTSGTTGLPKGVVHTRRRAAGIATAGSRARLDLAAWRSVLFAYPLYNTSGRMGIFLTLVAGGKAVLMDRLDPQHMLECIQHERITQLGAPPTLYRLLLRAPGQERYDLASLQRVAFTSEPMPRDLAQALHERLGCALENVYGTTESMFISWTGLGDSWQTAADTVGRPAPGARVRIVDDARQPLPVNTAGEIAVQTAQMMSGYYRSPELTRQVLDDAGWLYTGDIGLLGDDGYLRLIERKDDLIIRAGQNVYPAEVERFLLTHPAIRRVGVVGVPSPLSGQAVWAYVEPQPGALLSSGDVLDFCRGQMAPFKIPAQARILERLPVTALGKVQRFRLRSMAQAEISGELFPLPDGAP